LKNHFHTTGFLAFCLLTTTLPALAQTENAAIREGNKYYRKGQYDKALPEYERAITQNPNGSVARYNMSNARFRTGNYTEAEKAYEATAEAAASEKDRKQKSLYNKGVAQIKQQKLQESIATWKNALKMNPADEDARFNLQKALMEQRKQEQKDQKQPQQKQQQQQQKQKQPNKLDKKKIEQYLKSLEQKEQEVQRKMQQNRSRSVSQPEKDW
jgi:Ca-activated chloride channel homolog